MPAPAEIIQLVELFERNYDQYRNSAFTEAAVRHQFIDPFFAALGWDMYNAQGFAEQYKEVVHEDKVKVGAATKAPDYSFHIGKDRKFFVEAKKPAVDIQYDVEPAYQLRSYAWSAKLPLSILTDFEELFGLRLPLQARSQRQGLRGAYPPAELQGVPRTLGRDRRGV
jgi:hypothetical protein